MTRAVIDRIVDGEIAVILVGDDEQQFHYPAKNLPRGAREGSVLRVEVSCERIVALEVDRADTERTRQRIREKMEELRRRGR